MPQYELSKFEQFCIENRDIIKYQLISLVTNWLIEEIAAKRGINLDIFEISVDNTRHQLAKGKVGYLAKWDLAYNTKNLEIIVISVLSGSMSWDGADIISQQRELVSQLYRDWKDGEKLAIDKNNEQERKQRQIIIQQKQKQLEDWQKNKAKEIQKIWEIASLTCPENPYLVKKGLSDCSYWRYTDIRFFNNIIIARIRNPATGEILGFQKIFPEKINDHGKEFILVKETLSGGVVILKDPTEKDLPTDDSAFCDKIEIILVFEGLATALSAYLETRNILPTGTLFVCCLSSGMMGNAVANLRKKYGNKVTIMICGDDDKHLEMQKKQNAGRHFANEAAKKYKCGVVFPPFEGYGINRKNLTYQEIHDKYTDFNDLFQITPFGVKNTIIKAIEKHLQKQANEDISDLETINDNELNKIKPPFNFLELEKWILADKPNNCLLFTAGTGVGKTYHLLDIACKLNQIIDVACKQGKPCTLFASTLVEATRMATILKFMLIKQNRKPEDEMALITADSYLEEESSNKGGKLSLKLSNPILISTYGYLGRNGHSIKTYKRAKALLEGRIVFCDEIQELYKKMFNPFTFAGCYRLTESTKNKDSGTYSLASRCPKSAAKGTCSGCQWAFLHTVKEEKDKVKEYEFYHKFEKSSLAKHQEKYDLNGIITWQDLFTISKYFQVYKNLFAQLLVLHHTPTQTDLQNLLKQSEESKGNESIGEFLTHFVQCLDSPQIRVEMPISTQTENPLSPLEIAQMSKEEQDEKVQFPKQSCFTPQLYGLDVLPLVQLFTYAKKLVFTSATIPTDMASTIQDIAKKFGWKVDKQAINEIAYTFDVTLLKTTATKKTKNISNSRIFKILVELNKIRKEKMFVVASTKKELDEIATPLERKISKAVRVFKIRDMQTIACLNEERTNQFTLSYSRAAICRGVDMSDYNVVIIDCQQFSPMMTLRDLNPLMDKDEILDMLNLGIKENITQIIGRLLRSNLPRIPGETVKDDRKIVVLLHGLPGGIFDFTINPVLTHKQREITTKFANLDDKDINFVPAIVKAISNCLDEKEVEDYEAKEIQTLIDKGKEGKGIMQKLSKKQRENLKEEDLEEVRKEKQQQRQQQRLINYMAKLRQYKDNGLDWRDIRRKLNLDRKENLEIAIKLKKVFDYE